MMRKPFLLRLATASFLFGLSAAAGCVDGYERTDIDRISSSDLPGTISAHTILIPVGGVTTAHVAPFNSDNKPMVGEVVSDNPAVLEINKTSDDKVYAFLGISRGTTKVRLYADDKVVAIVDATVGAQ